MQSLLSENPLPSQVTTSIIDSNIYGLLTLLTFLSILNFLQTANCSTGNNISFSKIQISFYSNNKLTICLKLYNYVRPSTSTKLTPVNMKWEKQSEKKKRVRAW